MTHDLDASYAIDSAERLLGVKPGSLSLDELARRLSAIRPDELLSVREWRLSPVSHSKVYKAGEPTGARPYLMTSAGR